MADSNTKGLRPRGQCGKSNLPFTAHPIPAKTPLGEELERNVVSEMSKSASVAFTEDHLTGYQAKLIAYELTRRCPSDSLEKLAGGWRVAHGEPAEGARTRNKEEGKEMIMATIWQYLIVGSESPTNQATVAEFTAVLPGSRCTAFVSLLGAPGGSVLPAQGDAS